MKKKIIAIVLVAILIVGVLFFLIPLLTPNTLSVQFYDDEGNKVGLPLTPVPLLVTKDGVEVASFSITVTWDTNNPDISYIEWDVSLDVYYYISDIPGADNQVHIFTGLVWSGSGSMSGEKTQTSGLLLIDAYASSVPEGQVFFMAFAGEVRFYTGNPEHSTQVLIATVAFIPVSTILKREAHTYTATLGIGW